MSHCLKLHVISSVSASQCQKYCWATFKPPLGSLCELSLLCEFHSSQVQRWDSWNQGYDMMLKFATPQRLGVPSHCLITLSQRLIERLIKYKELHRNQREEKQSFPKEEFYRILTFVSPILRILTRSEKTNSFSFLCFGWLKKRLS